MIGGTCRSGQHGSSVCAFSGFPGILRAVIVSTAGRNLLQVFRSPVIGPRSPAPIPITLFICVPQKRMIYRWNHYQSGSPCSHFENEHDCADGHRVSSHPTCRHTVVRTVVGLTGTIIVTALVRIPVEPQIQVLAFVETTPGWEQPMPQWLDGVRSQTVHPRC